MISDNVQLSGVCIVADESAEWRCAGLRQIDRLLLELNAYAAMRLPGEHALPVYVAGAERLPRPPTPALRLLTDPGEFIEAARELPGSVAVMPTNLVFSGTDDLTEWLRAIQRTPASMHAPELTSDFPDRLRDSAAAVTDGHYLRDQSDIAGCEERLLRSTGKTQDGIISRYLNRPISRRLTRILLPTPVTPNQVTIALMILPLLGLYFLTHGSYWAFVAGALFFHLHSALDGCDGEIARVKFLQSSGGAKLDEICDRLSTLIYAVGLGFGLYSRHASAHGNFYRLEGIIAAAVIGVGESLLTLKPIDHSTAVDPLYSEYERRYRGAFNRGDHLKLWIMRHSNILAVGEDFANFFGHITKRDVFNFGFFILAVLGRPTWILHIFAACAVIILALATARGLAAVRSWKGRPAVTPR